MKQEETSRQLLLEVLDDETREQVRHLRQEGLFVKEILERGQARGLDPVALRAVAVTAAQEPRG